MEVTHAAEVSVSNGVRRGVVDFLDDLPQYKEPAYLNLPRGTEYHPFVVLEIVPYEEYAEIGYLIGGCEPVDISKMYGDYDMYQLISLGNANIQVSSAYFFIDEPQGDKSLYTGSTSNASNNTTVNGYYELVESGGNFLYKKELLDASLLSLDISVFELQEEVTNVNDLTENNIDITGNDDYSENVNDIEDVTSEQPENEIPSSEESESMDIPAVNDGVEDGDDTEAPFEQVRGNGLILTSQTGGELETQTTSTDMQAGSEPVGTEKEVEGPADPEPEKSEEPANPEPEKSEEPANSESDGIEALADSEPEETEEPTEPEPEETEEPEMVWVVNIDPVDDGSGNLIWRTINEFDMDLFPELSDYASDFKVYSKEMLAEERNLLWNPGDRIYTTRTSKNNNLLNIQQYFVYRNNEYFLTQSLSLTKEQAANYSIVVKTITPEQLNQMPAWVDYADLIYLHPTSHMESLADVWMNQNGSKVDYNEPHTGEGYNLNNYDYTKAGFGEEHDLLWDVVSRIYNKVTADTNYAGIIIDDTIYNNTPLSSEAGIVYDWNLQPTTWPKYTIDVSDNNVYKLCVMLLSMDSNLFKQLYLNGNNSLINNGVFKLRANEGILADHWGFGTFLLVPPGQTSPPEKAWYSQEYWNNYHMTATPTQESYKYWCNEHVFTFKGDNTMTTGYAKDTMANAQNFKDFNASLSEGEKPLPSLAVRYILNSGNNSNNGNYGQGMTLKVLDLEPSVGLNKDATPNWFLTRTYVYMLLPHFKGNVEIEHQTTAEFIGKIEDLNTTYGLIYMGLDCSGYNTKEWDIGNGVKAVLPDWNDNSLDQKIYIRTGDLAMSKEGGDGYGYLSANWLYDKSTKTLANTGQRMRFAGNDISRLKKADLEDFLNAYYPIVAEQQLFDLDTRIIETNTYIYQLISEQKAQNKPIYGTSSTALIENAARNALGNAITFVESPVRYDGTTVSDTSPEFKNTNCYLPRNAYGNAYLYFKINAATSGYRYRIYVDLNRDSRFSDDEIMNDTSGTKNVLAVGDNEYLQPLPSDWVGLLQWKAEVYLETNPSVRYEMTGCSAVQRNASTSSGKKKVTVLHIMPEWGSGYQGALNLQTNGTFIKYYEDLEDYDVTITSISYDEYEKYFYYLDNRGQRKSWNFTYDYSKEMDENNPYNLDKLHNDNYADLMNYNMIIVGFGDCYGSKNMTNQYGQMDFLRYFADQGRSILFTHDLTTFYNAVTTNLSFTANTQLRDIMGMNRYASVNYYLDTTIRNRLIADQAANADKYDTNYTPETHGFTYFAIKRMGQVDGQVYRMPYRNMVNNLQGNPIGEQGTGFNFDNDPTTQVSKVNEGQITVYPYKIDDNFKIAETHSQYYQLSPEDDNLTVWYCLAGDGDIAHTYGTGTSLTYAVSPNDTMENYYIYSKGNIFYSGVGHSTVTGDMEAKLFVNTMIAAYNAAYEPPKVEVTNPEAISRGSFEYDIELMQSYDFDEHGNLVATASNYYDVNENGELVYNVIFTPQDYNLASGTTLECQIQWENGDYVTEVVRLSDGAILHADSNNVFHNFKKGQEYSLEYPMKYLSDYHWEKTINGELKSGEYIRTISFSIKNNRVDAKNITVLNINVLPLFPLD